MMAPESLDTLVGFLKALADASRLRIIGLVADRERSVDELATLLDLKAPTVSHHLKRLKDRNLVTVRAAGNIRYYRLNESALHFLNKEVFKREAIRHGIGPDGAGAEDGDVYARKVFKSFIVDDRLTAIPAQRKKRDVILRWLVQRFEMGLDYPEREVNEIIRPVHPDVATLRRELIGLRLMARERGIYRRLA